MPGLEAARDLVGDALDLTQQDALRAVRGDELRALAPVARGGDGGRIGAGIEHAASGCGGIERERASGNANAGWWSMSTSPRRFTRRRREAPSRVNRVETRQLPERWTVSAAGPFWPCTMSNST